MKTAFRSLLIFLLTYTQAFGAGPVIWNGTRSKALTSKGFLLSDQSVVDNDGQLNYIKNGHGEVNITGWSAYADAAGTTPVDCTGGSPTETVTRTTSSPLIGAGSILLTKDAANRQGEGISYAFTIDPAYASQTLFVTLFGSGSANYAASDIGVYLYDVTGTTIITPNVSNLSATTNFSASFATTANTSYRLCIHTKTTNALAYTYKLDDVKILASAPSSAPAATLPQYNVDIGDSSSLRQATNTNLLGESIAQTRAQAATITIAAPGVVTSNSHGMSLGDKFYFTTTGALPTGVSANTTYYASAIAANTFNISTTFANAIAGTYVTTTGSQSGVHTLNMGGITGVLPGSAANATRAGQMVYVHGGTYNGGGAPTITLSSGGGTLTTVNLAEFVPYQMADTNWRCKFNIAVTLSSTSRAEAVLAASGITFATSATDGQAIAVSTNGGTSIIYGLVGSNNNTIAQSFGTVATTRFYFSGDVKLASKPTWAY